MLLPSISPFWIKWFTWYARKFVAKNFHAVRLARSSPCAGPSDKPWVIYLNHPAWWDPMIGVVLASSLFPTRTNYVVIEAAMLEKYQVFKKVGFFGVEPGSPRGAIQFLQTSSQILQRADSILWLTAEGTFTDPRLRPVQLKPGIGHLATRHPHAAFIPLALEYSFWDERYPNALAAFGKPLLPCDQLPQSPDAWTRQFASSLQFTMDTLAASSIPRRESNFDVLLSGRVGIGGAYDLSRRMQAILKGEKFDPGHRSK